MHNASTFFHSSISIDVHSGQKLEGEIKGFLPALPASQTDRPSRGISDDFIQKMPKGRDALLPLHTCHRNPPSKMRKNLVLEGKPFFQSHLIASDYSGADFLLSVIDIFYSSNCSKRCSKLLSAGVVRQKDES